MSENNTYKKKFQGNNEGRYNPSGNGYLRNEYHCNNEPTREQVRRDNQGSGADQGRNYSSQGRRSNNYGSSHHHANEQNRGSTYPYTRNRDRRSPEIITTRNTHSSNRLAEGEAGDFLGSWRNSSTSRDLSLSREVSKVEEKKKSTVSYTSSEGTNAAEQADDEEIDWVISNESTSSNLILDRPQSPRFDNDKESKQNIKRNRPQHNNYDYDNDNKISKGEGDGYKGVSFSPPFPICPVIPATHTERSKVAHIFDNDSRSSAQSFDNLVQIATEFWNTRADVPLALASAQDVNPEQYINQIKKKSISEEVKSPVPPKDSDMISSSKGLVLKIEQKKFVNVEDDMRSSGPVERFQEDYFAQKKSVSEEPPVPENPQKRDLSETRPSNGLYEKGNPNPKSITASTSSSTHKKAPVSNIGFLRAALGLSRPNIDENVNEIMSKIPGEYFPPTELIQDAVSLRSRKQVVPQKTREAEEVCNMVDSIFRTIPTEWLYCTLGATHKLIPKIVLFDTEAIQKLLKILSSHLVLKPNNKDTEQLIKIVIAEPSFFEKVFSYMKEEVNCGSDLVPIIRLTEFIVKLSSEAAQKVPLNDITEVCKRIGSTFSEAESIEVHAKYKVIKEYQSRETKNVDRKVISSKPDWITLHTKNRVEKPLVPLPKEIFDLKAMITKPKLTPHYVNQSWLPEYEEIYRQVHYDLLRTEVVEDLQRASVAFFAAHCQKYHPPENSPLQNYIFYHDVRIVNTYIDKNFTPYVRVGFKPSRPVDWIKGEHLIYGTFVLLFKVKIEFNDVSIDMSSMIWAMVEYFNLEDVVRPNGDKDPISYLQSQENFVGLNFSVTEFDKLDLNGKYFMLESTRNYALIRPVMEWLKETVSGIRKTFPLYQELFKCYLDKQNKENNSVPGYLENVSFNITSMLVDKRRPIITKDRSEWPPYQNPNGTPAYDMEFSCVVALRQIISRKVAVIVAPVVTSKAKVAAKAVELLSQAFNQSHCFEPILILARSTYALDSILEQLLPSFPDLIRCGSLSKCSNSALKARQIQDVVNEHYILRRTTLYKEWKRIREEMNREQAGLADLWRFKKSALSLQYFIDSCPGAFRDQLVPKKYVNNNNNNNRSRKSMFVRFLELWLAGESESTAIAKFMGPNEEDFPALSGSSNRFNLQRTASNTNRPPQENINPQFSPSLLTELSESYLFENDRTKSNERNNDIISAPSEFDKEILEHQMNDRVIFKSEEGQSNSNEWYTREGQYNSRRNQIDFDNATKSFWSGKIGPNIWTMPPDTRSSLYEKFCQHHLSYCDEKIRDLQKNAILEAEKVKSTRIARWTEVCNFTPVIGMTLSYATSHREVLTSIKPRVCIVDEASEIPEAQLMFLISSDRLEHLIMFGDIQYSKPDIKSKTAQSHGLDVSLFERWIKCGGDHICLKQQSRMHPSVHELIRTLYDEDVTENVAAENNTKILGVPSHVFFMTHDNFDDDRKQANTFEAAFIVRFAYYLYQQGYDPAKITILTPYLPQKRLILESLKPELKRQKPSSENKYGRYDKERNKTGMIKVELIDEYNSEENQIVLLSLVAVSKNRHKEVLETLNDKKRAIIALSRALRALYIFGNEAMLRKSKIWAPVVNKLAATTNTYGKSLILSCKTHINTKIEITDVKDFENKVPYGGCSEPCNGLLTCGHACPRKCHPINHTNEINYVCHRQCGGRYKPDGCEHDCPMECYECEQSGKCPSCNQLVKTKLRCGHEKSMPCHQALNMDRANHVCEEYVILRLQCGHKNQVKCYQRHNEEVQMTMECREMKTFTFENCNHSVRLACSTKSPVCRETCGKHFPCGHRCQLQCGVEHSHERIDCKNECTKSLICGHLCANGCSEPDRHTSFCTKQCRIKCLHGRICPNNCHETCTRCLEPCPWKCKHYTCSKKCNEFCNRPPCNNGCSIILKCGHPCNGLCGEVCPPCILCNPSMQCKITLQTFSEMSRFERLYMLPECECVFTTDGLDLYFANQVKSGEHTAVKLWQCPSCQEPIFTAMRYNYKLKVEINLWNIIKRKQELARNSLSAEERRQIIDAMNEETRTTDINSMVGGRWFVCPNNHPYYIGNCGGATQISQCPECSETIGGTQHRVVFSNRFYGEFDNSVSPAWPGQH